MKPAKSLKLIVDEVDSLSSLAREPVSISKKAGQFIIREREPAQFMYIVKEGAVDISHDGIRLERVVKGGIFGEMALVDDAPRSANAVAFKDTVLIPVSRDRFSHLVRASPDFAILVMNTMIRRIRQMNVRLEIATKRR